MFDSLKICFESRVNTIFKIKDLINKIETMNLFKW